MASIKGGKPPIDGDSLDFNDPINKKFWDDADFQGKLTSTLKLSDVNSADFDAIFFVIAELTKTASSILGVDEKFFYVLVKENDLDNWGVGGKTLAQFLAEQKK